VWSVAIVGGECVRERLGAVAFVVVAVGVSPAFEQCADEAFCLSVGLRPVGARLADADLGLVAALAPAAFEAGAVVGEDALDPDPVSLIEAVTGGEEGERGLGGLVGVDASKPSLVASSIATNRYCQPAFPRGARRERSPWTR